MLGPAHPEIDDRAVELIADRVTAALREELHALLAPDSTATHPARGMTVEQVALRLGVSRSTVYAHWREWGGYKLGSGEKAPIRFDASSLPNRTTDGATRSAPPDSKPRQRRRRASRTLIADAPRLPQPFDQAA